jgi:hypothetical protein
MLLLKHRMYAYTCYVMSLSSFGNTKKEDIKENEKELTNAPSKHDCFACDVCDIEFALKEYPPISIDSSIFLLYAICQIHPVKPQTPVCNRFPPISQSINNSKPTYLATDNWVDPN